MKLSDFIALLILPMHCIGAFGQSLTGNLTVLKQWSDTPGSTIYIDGTTAYFGSDGFFEIVDFEDPLNPLEIGRLALPDTISAVAVQDGRAYLGTVRGGLHVLDIFDTQAMRELGSFETPFLTKNSVIGAAPSGNFIYLFYRERIYRQGGLEGLFILDASNMDNLHEAGSYYWRTSHQVDFLLPFIYFLGSNALFVLDITPDLTSPPLVEAYGFTFGPRTFAIEDMLIYTFTQDSLVVLNITDPYNLKHAGGTTLGDNPPLRSDLAVQNGLAYLCEFTSLRIFDVSNSNSAFELGKVDVGGHDGQDLAVSDSIAYIAHYDRGLTLVDVSDPQNPMELTNFNRKLSFNSVTLKDNLAFAGFEDGGIWVIDFWSEEHPKLLGSFSGVEQESGMVLRDNLLLVADRNRGLLILDISEPVNIIEVGYLPLADQVERIAAFEDYVYLTVPSKGAIIIDISDVENPTETGSILGLHPTAITLVNGMLYIATAEEGMFIFDVATTPNQPAEIGRYSESNLTLNDVAVMDGFAYLASGSKGLTILDVSSPADILLTRRFGTGSAVQRVRLDGEFAYVAENKRMLVVDISNQAEPAIKATYKPNSFHIPNNVIRNLSVFGDTVFVSQNASLFILKYDAGITGIASDANHPQQFGLFQNYPNPFNPQTTIRYTVSIPGRVGLRVYNVHGQLVNTLVDGSHQAGEYEVLWDGKNEAGDEMPSGLYFYRLKIGTKTEYRRMVLLR